MIKFQLTIGYFGSTPELSSYDLFGKSISRTFHESSDKDIVLNLNLSHKNSTAKYPEVTESLNLHTALNMLLNKVPGQRSIGLIFAGSYKPKPDALGVMFDRGFKTDDDPYGNLEEFHVPRLGCAVFLDTVNSVYSRDSQEYIDLSIYTAIHELGHIFNLVHIFNKPNFMRGGNPEQLEDEDQFTEDDCKALGTCSWDSLITPGGLPFRDRSDEINSSSSHIKLDSSSSQNQILFEINTARKEIFRFEPLELNIQIRLLPGKNNCVTIPDEIDPGYSSFKVWIEHPTGELFLYRSPRHYCSTGSKFTLSEKEVFERDISIFGQSGGYTFGEPGEYSIRASFRTEEGKEIHSNSIKLDVLPITKDCKDLLIIATPGIARLLYYRSSHPRSKYLKLLHNYREENVKNINAGVIDYTIGRIYANFADNSKSRLTKNEYTKQSLLNLRRAIDHKFLGCHARQVAETIIEKFQS